MVIIIILWFYSHTLDIIVILISDTVDTSVLTELLPNWSLPQRELASHKSLVALRPLLVIYAE